MGVGCRDGYQAAGLPFAYGGLLTCCPATVMSTVTLRHGGSASEGLKPAVTGILPDVRTE